MLSRVVKKETPEMTTGFLPIAGTYTAICRESKRDAMRYLEYRNEVYPGDYSFIFTVREKPLDHQGSFFGWK